MSQTLNPHRLPVQEWLAVLTIIILLALLTAIVLLNKNPYDVPTKDPLYLRSPFIEITVEGAVSQPGKQLVKKGSTVKELLEKIELTPDADLERINWDKTLKRKQTLKIPIKKKKNNIDTRCKTPQQL